jgi:hypothetical protein
VARWLRWADDPDRLNVENSVSARTPNFDRFDLSAEVTLGNVTLKPGAGHIPYQPLIVVRTSSAIIDDHSGIFTEPFLQFLIPYIALIESKTALNPKESFDRRQEAL